MSESRNSRKWQEGWTNVKNIRWGGTAHSVAFSLSAIAFFYIRAVGLSQQRWEAYDLIRTASGAAMALCWYLSFYFEPADKKKMENRETRIILAVMAAILLIIVEIGMAV